MKRTYFKNNNQTRIKIAKAIYAMSKSSYCSKMLLKSKLQQEDLVLSGAKLQQIWNNLVNRHVVRKERGLYKWNGNLDIWSDIDQAVKQVVPLVNEKTSLRKPKEVKKEESSIVVIDPFANFSDEDLVNELRNRGWSVTCQKNVIVTL